MSDDQLSDIFKRDLPTPPDGAWTQDARRRAGRRRATLGGLALVAALAVVSPFALQMMNKDGDIAVPAPIGTEPSSPADRTAACDGAAEAAVDELPDDAVRLWLCDEPGEGGMTRTGPTDALIEGVDEALAAFSALPEADPNQACTMEYFLTYTVVAEGADGTMTPVNGQMHGCRTVGNRSGADQFLTTLAGLWQEQRSEAPAEGGDSTVEQLCAAPASILPATMDGVTDAALCAGHASPEPGVGVTLSPELVEAVREDVAANAVDGVLGEYDTTALLTLANPWGEAITMTRFPSGAYGFNDQVWRPKGDLATELNALIASMEIPPVEAYVTEPVLCEEPRTAVAGSPATVPDGITSVGVCIEEREGELRFRGPQSPYEADYAQRIADAFNALPIVDEQCDDELARVFVQFKNEEFVDEAVAELTSCGLRVGDVTKDATGFMETFYDISHEQLGADGAAMHFSAAELCPQLDSLVPFDPTTSGVAQVAACVGGEGDGLSVDLSVDLVDAIEEDISVGEHRSRWEPEGGTLVLVNRFGEPRTLLRGSDGSFGWSDHEGRGPLGGATLVWTPSPEIGEQLDRIFGL